MATFRNIHDYSDIINLPYQKSTRHPPMSTLDRAAQFAPFAALTGHKEAVLETARYVSSKKVLDDDQKQIINQQLQSIKENMNSVELTYFVSDNKKSGGTYITDVISVKKIDEYEKVIITNDNQRINIDDIYEILEIHNL
ncbi:MAG: YolD-like family protein [Erysipelotrichaceae bacterium]|nr:YolD-like family protein [Erysipelotrichaceae bacterium]